MRLLTIAAILLVGGTAAPVQDDHQNAPPIPGWHPDVAAGMKEAAETGKPLLVVFR